MNDRELEARLRAWYRSEVSETEAAPLALRLDVASIPRTATPTARRFGRGRGMTLLAAAAAVVLVGGALAAGSGVLRQQGIVPPVTAPSLAAVAISSPTAPSTPFPTPTAAPIVWTQASLREDWPAQVRPEPAAGSGAAPMPPTYIDPSGDAGSDATSYVDIRDVTANPSGVSFDLMSKPPDVDPSQAWIAYGLVVDTNGDGVADFRYGIDNLPSSVGQDLHRAWRTDLHKGRTEFDPKPEGNGGGGRDDFSQVGATQFGTGYPAGAIGTGPRWNFYASFDTPSGEGHDGAKQDKPFYVWASAIVGGQVVATDYAPDTGWLTPNRNGANPGGTYVVQLDPAAVAKGVLPDLSTRISLVVPRGWAANGASVNGPGGALEFRRPEHLGACDTSGNAITPIGPTVDDLATFLAHQRGVTTSANSAVTVDGYGGTYLEYTVAADPIGDIPDPLADCGSCCASGEFHQVWILDIDGVRLVIDASAAKASDTVKAAFQQIVDSVAFEPVAAPTPTPTPAPTPTPTPTPVPTPTPTPFPAAAGPVPHGARSWEVTVENRKSKPATLFLAEAPFNDLSDLCGSVTPDVVLAGVTEKVTFQMPPKGQTECWLMVEPGPGADGAFGPTDGWPIPGPRRLVIGAPGENGPDSATLWEGP